jgi:hypothetical protein
MDKNFLPQEFNRAKLEGVKGRNHPIDSDPFLY